MVGTRIDEVFWSVDLSRDLPMFFGNSINMGANPGGNAGPSRANRGPGPHSKKRLSMTLLLTSAAKTIESVYCIQ